MVFLWGIIFSLGRAYVWLKFKNTPPPPPPPPGVSHTHIYCSMCLYIVTYYHFQMSKHYKCAICGKYRLKHHRPIRTQSLKEYVEKTIGRSTNEDDVICSKCRSAYLYKRSVRDSYDTEGCIIALIFINFKSANIILNCYSKSPMLKINATDLIDV